MNPQIAALVVHIRSLEAELELEIAKRRTELQFEIKNRKVVFEADVRRRHAELKTRVTRYLAEARLLSMLTAPIIYSVIVPLLLLDLFVSLYQAVCFPVYGIEKVKRRDYMIFDRSKLAYLNFIEKVNCAYCSYGNGLLGYVREVTARTEEYWCPIKHAQRVLAAHAHYSGFADYGDAEGYRRMQDKLKEKSEET